MESRGKHCRDLSSVNHVLKNRHILLQIVEGVASGSLNFISGLQVATLSTWPREVLPVGILIGNTIVVACLISATAAATGGHINPMVTISTAFSGLCHPVRAMVYISCQLTGGALGGALLRVALGKPFADRIHNAGCWIDPDGEVNVWQAALIEFVCSFILLFVVFFFLLPVLTPLLNVSTLILLQVPGLRCWIGSSSS